LAVYLPGAGWLHYDPTNRISQGSALIPVALARHPGQAIPLQGTWYGSADDYLGMTVQVSIHKVADIPKDA
jgi:transglutaminase-like putative cysteine protease